MVEYPGAVYRGGHESVLLFGAEAGMLAVDATTIGAVPTMGLVGMTSPPQIIFDNAPAPEYGGGAIDPLFMTENRKTVSASGTITLGAGAGTKSFLQAALSGTDAPILTYPLASRQNCQPVIALAYGSYNACATGSGFLSYLRYAMMNSLQITIGGDGSAKASWGAMALVSGDAVAPLAAGAITPAALQQASGTPLSMQHLQLIITPPVGTAYDYQGVINSITFSATNSITARGIRSLANAGGNVTNPLYRAARQLVPGTRPPLSITLDLADRIPNLAGGSVQAILSDGSTTTSGTVTTTNSLTFATQIAFNQTATQNGGDNSGPMSFGRTLLCSGLVIS